MIYDIDCVDNLKDTGGDLASVSANAAHQLGHIFSMQHDDIDPTSKKLYSSLHHYTACYFN